MAGKILALITNLRISIKDLFNKSILQHYKPSGPLAKLQDF